MTPRLYGRLLALTGLAFILALLALVLAGCGAGDPDAVEQQIRPPVVCGTSTQPCPRVTTITEAP
jgi:hypothetical protein